MRSRKMLGHVLGLITATMLLAGGLVAATTVASDAHTDDIKVTAECNTTTGEYDFAAVMTTSNVPSNVTGSTMWRIGTSSFDGTPTSASGMNKGPVSTTGNMTVTLGTWTMSGDTTGLGPWVYAYTTWSNGNKKGSDSQLTQSLNGDCTPDDACPDLPGTQPPGSDCTPPTTDECSDLPGDQPPGAQCEPQSQKQERDVEKGPNCKIWATVTKHQERTRTQEYVNGAYVWPKWSAWKTVSSSSVSLPFGVCKAKVRAHCVTKHWGEGAATLFNSGAQMSNQFRIVRSNKDRVVTVRASHNRTINLTGLRVGSHVTVRSDGKVLARDLVEGGCGHTPPPNTGARQAAG